MPCRSEKMDTMPISSDAVRYDAFSFLADECFRVADAIRWPKALELGEIEKMAESVSTGGVGYYTLGDLLDTTFSEQDDLYHLLQSSRPSGRGMRKPHAMPPTRSLQ